MITCRILISRAWIFYKRSNCVETCTATLEIPCSSMGRQFGMIASAAVKSPFKTENLVQEPCWPRLHCPPRFYFPFAQPRKRHMYLPRFARIEDAETIRVVDVFILQLFQSRGTELVDH